MDRAEAILRLMILKYMGLEVSEDGTPKIIMPKKYASDYYKQLLRGVAVFKEDKNIEILSPLEAMRRLATVEPFSNLYTKYSTKYTIPEHLFVLNSLAEQVAFRTYFVPVRDGKVRVNGKEFNNVGVQKETGRFVWHMLDKSGEPYFMVMAVRENRDKNHPPLRGLLWKEKDLDGFPEGYIIDAVRLNNLSWEKFPQQVTMIDAFDAQEDSKRVKYEIYRVVRRNPVLDISERKLLIKRKDGSEVKTFEVDEFYGENVITRELLVKYLKENGIDNLNDATLEKYIIAEIEKDMNSALSGAENDRGDINGN